MTKNPIWSIEYRPKTLADCVLPERIREQMEGLLAKGNLPNMIFAGSPGSGKTTLARALLADLDANILFLNGSGEDRGIDTVKNKIASFASTMTMDGKRKYVLYDEADNLTHDGQMALRALIEEVSGQCGFVMTANFPSRIIEPLRSRCKVISFDVRKNERRDFCIGLAKRLVYILQSENVEVSDMGAIQHLVKTYYPDMRQMINTAQSTAASGAVDLGSVESILSDDTMLELVGYMKNGKWKMMLNWVVNSNVSPNDLIKYLFDHAANLFDNESLPEAVVIMHDHQKDLPISVDQDLCMVAMLTNLMSRCTFK